MYLEDLDPQTQYVEIILYFLLKLSTSSRLPKLTMCGVFNAVNEDALLKGTYDKLTKLPGYVKILLVLVEFMFNGV